MEKLITLPDNTQEEFDADLLGQFMKKVTIWNHASITTDSYLALSHDEKERLIRRYYIEMKNGGNGNFSYIFYCLRRSCHHVSSMHYVERTS